MYIYVANIIKNPIYIHFLCGNRYVKKPDKITTKTKINKRVILAEYIDSLPNHYSVILEEFFTLHTYKVNSMGNLKEIELMTSYLSTSVMVMHETYSTAAEIGVFGNLEELANKMLVIYPSKESIKFDCVGTFIRESFFTGSIVENQSYPYSTHRKKNQRFPTTYFAGNTLDSKFLSILNNFFDKVCKSNIDVSFSKNYDKCVGYYISVSEKRIHITLSYEILFYSLLAAITNLSIMKDARDPDEFTMNFSSIIKNIFQNTVEKREKVNPNDFSVSINMIDGYEINKPIKFIYFLLLKLELINIVEDRIEVTRKLSNIIKNNDNILMKEDKKDFFGDENNEKGL